MRPRSHRPPRETPAHSRSRFSLSFALSLIVATFAIAAAPAAIRFDIPAGAAEQTLRQFSVQSGVQLAFATDVVRGVRTNPVRGEFPPADALESMVAGTPLVVVRDEKPGAFAIRRDPNVPRAALTTASDRPRQNQNRPNAADSANAAEPVLQLSPFEVTAEEDNGYKATSTLAGTRLRSDL